VNLIGEHTDYNDGFVFPMAIPLYTIMVGALNKNPSRVCRIKSLESCLGENNVIEFSLDELKHQDKPYNWANYIIGVVANFDGIHSSLFLMNIFFNKIKFS
jgi:galactokinase